jgi:imidazoleglycerol-phosphate dehydratase
MTPMQLVRHTKETRIEIAESAKIDIVTPFPFFSHMLVAFCTYADLSVQLKAVGDLRHHIIEDTALTLGAWVRKRAPQSAARYGERTIPMDDALVQAVIDIGGRAYFSGRLPSKMYTHWFRSFSTAAESTLHLRVLRGNDKHHVLECAFKAAGLALRQAMRSEGSEVFSTKGTVSLTFTPSQGQKP